MAEEIETIATEIKEGNLKPCETEKIEETTSSLRTSKEVDELTIGEAKKEDVNNKDTQEEGKDNTKTDQTWVELAMNKDGYRLKDDGKDAINNSWKLFEIQLKDISKLKVELNCRVNQLIKEVQASKDDMDVKVEKITKICEMAYGTGTHCGNPLKRETSTKSDCQNNEGHPDDEVETGKRRKRKREPESGDEDNDDSIHVDKKSKYQLEENEYDDQIRVRKCIQPDCEYVQRLRNGNMMMAHYRKKHPKLVSINPKYCVALINKVDIISKKSLSK